MKGSTWWVSMFLLAILGIHSLLLCGQMRSTSLMGQTTGLSRTPSTLLAGTTPLWGWTLTEIISHENSTDAYIPHLVADDRGNIHAIWYDSFPSEFAYRLWNATRNAWDPVAEVDGNLSGSSSAPAIAVDAAGNLHVTWTDNTNYSGAGTDRDIFYQRWNATSRCWTQTEIISIVSEADSGEASIAVDSKENIHVVWSDHSDYDGCGSDLDIFYRMWNATADIWVSTQVITPNSTVGSSMPSMAVDPQGTIHAIWVEYNSPYDIYHRGLNATSSIWGAIEQVSTENLGDAWTPRLAADGTGNLHIVWSESSAYGGSGPDDDIMYKRWNATTGNWTVAEVVSTESTGNSIEPAIVTDEGGNLHVAWRDRTNLSGAGTDNDIFYKCWNATSDQWSPVEVVSTESTDQSTKPTIAVDVTGGIHVAWEDRTNYNGAGSDWDIFYKKKVSLPPAPVLSPIVPTPDYDGRIALNWTAVPGATRYYLYRDTSSLLSVAGRTPLQLSSTNHSTDQVPQSGVYYYAIVAGTGLLNSTPSNCENVTVMLPEPAAPILAPITPNLDLDGIITVTWGAVASATIYQIYRDTVPITTVEGLTPFHSTNATSWTDRINASGSYYYVVVAGNASGTSAPSNCERVVVVILPPIPGFSFAGGVLGVCLLGGVLYLTARRPMRRDNNKSGCSPWK